MEWIVGLIIGGAAGLAGGYFLPADWRSKITGGSLGARAFGKDKKRLEEAQAEAKQIRQEAKEKASRMRQAFEKEAQSMQESFQRMETLITQKEDILKRREDRNRSYQNTLKKLQEEIWNLSEQQKQSLKESMEGLSKVSKLSREDALKQAENTLTELLTTNRERRAKVELEEFEEDIARHAKAVLQIVIQRLGVPSSVDKNSTSIKVRDDKFKGMLVGKNGKNIAYLESLLPISVIFNLGDSKTIHVGGVNLIRRNIAKRAISKMQKRVKKTGNITHAMIDEAVAEAEKEIMAECDRKGAWAFKQMGLDPKAVDPEVVNYVGRLYFRTSYGQNIIHHSLEMAYAARLIAELIGTDVETAMLAAFYHDLGKAIDHDIGGVAHDDLSKEILEKHNFDPAIVHAAYAHHDKVPCEAPADYIVKAVDAISGGRPGARMESVTNYFERIKQLESAAKSFEGVNKVFAMSAGRELRVMVNRDQIKDEDMEGLAENVAGKISEEISFPGLIKVNLIRTTKSVDYAKEKRGARRHSHR